MGIAWAATHLETGEVDDGQGGRVVVPVVLRLVIGDRGELLEVEHELLRRLWE